MSDELYPRRAPKPEPEDTVAVLMTEKVARRFEARCLGAYSELAGPMLFSEDDTPTYIIGLKKEVSDGRRETDE